MSFFSAITTSIKKRLKKFTFLRAFRDYCPNAQVYCADIDQRVLFEKNRIKKFFTNQTKPETYDPLFKILPSDFDLIIDDELHAPDANIASLAFGLKVLKKRG